MPDGRSVITGSQDGFVKRRDASTGVELEHFRIEGPPFTSMALSHDGTILAGGGRDRTRLLDLANHTEIGVLEGHQGRVLDVAFSHDGKRLTTAGEGDHAIRLFEIPSGRFIRSFQGHGRDVRSVRFVADDSVLVSCSDDLTVRTWDVASGSQQALCLGHTERVWGLSISPDGQTTVSASADRTIKTWDIRSPGSHTRLPIGQPAAFVYTPDSRTLVTLGVSPWCIARWDAETGRLIGRTPLDLQGADILCFAFSPDAQRLAIAKADGLTLWNSGTGRREFSLDKSPGKVIFVGFSTDRHHLLVHDLIGGWRVWDAANGRQISFPDGARVEANFTSPGEGFGASVAGASVTWDVVTGTSKRDPKWQSLHGSFSVITTNGRVLAAADPNSRRIHIGSAITFDLERQLPENSYCGGWLSLTPDGRTLAAPGSEQSVKLWDVATGEELLNLEIHTDRALSPCFSPDGATLAVCTVGYADGFQFHLWHSSRNESESIAEDSPSVPVPQP